MASALNGDVGVSLLVAGAVSGDVLECVFFGSCHCTVTEMQGRGLQRTWFHHCTQLGSAVNEVSMKLRGSIDEV